MMHLKTLLILFVFFEVIDISINKNVRDRHPSFPYVCQQITSQMLPKAKGYVKHTKNLLKFLTINNITVTEDQPGYSFFNGNLLSDKVDNIYRNSEITMKISQSISDLFYKKGIRQWTNLTPLLKTFSSCIDPMLKEFCVGNKNISCSEYNSFYRSIDGICNHRDLPKLGAARTPYGTMYPSTYEDGIQTIRKTLMKRKTLPEPRAIVKTLFSDCKSENPIEKFDLNMGTIIFGQFIANDVGYKKIPQIKSGGPGISCCTKDGRNELPTNLLHPDCIPIKISENDSGQKNRRCMNFVRSQTIINNDCTLSPRKQVNLQTSYLDLSQLYGTTKDKNHDMRTLKDGLMKTDKFGLFGRDKKNKFILGDKRATLLPVLSIFYTIFLREHNRVAKILKKLKPKWNDEEIFQETRRFVIAEYQQIIYEEWLPIFQGSTKERLRSPKKMIDPSTTNEFAHATFRFFHMFSPEIFNFYNSEGIINGRKKLSDSIYSTMELEKMYDQVARSIYYQQANTNPCRDEYVNRISKNSDDIGFDLLSIDILRGRDHGIAPYSIYVEMCHGRKIRDFKDLSRFLSKNNIEKLKKIYKTVFDIDLYVGGSLESFQSQYILGPTFNCLLNEQFHRFKVGDNFFYNNPKHPYPFKPDQMKGLMLTSFARLLCDNTNITKVPINPFLLIDEKSNRLVDCRNVPELKFIN